MHYRPGKMAAGMACLFCVVTLSQSCGSVSAQDKPVRTAASTQRAVKSVQASRAKTASRLQSASRAQRVEVSKQRLTVAQLRRSTWKWQDLAAIRRTPTSYAEQHTNDLRHLRRMVRHWSTLDRQAMERARDLPDRAVLMCIHHLEGSWTENTGNGYYGGMQADKYFEAAYGRKYVLEHGGHIAGPKGKQYAVGGHANTWPPLEQLQMSENAIKAGRGFSPWPRTAPPCLS